MKMLLIKISLNVRKWVLTCPSSVILGESNFQPTPALQIRKSIFFSFVAILLANSLIDANFDRSNCMHSMFWFKHTFLYQIP